MICTRLCIDVGVVDLDVHVVGFDVDVDSCWRCVIPWSVGLQREVAHRCGTPSPV